MQKEHSDQTSIASLVAMHVLLANLIYTDSRVRLTYKVTCTHKSRVTREQLVSSHKSTHKFLQVLAKL